MAVDGNKSVKLFALAVFDCIYGVFFAVEEVEYGGFHECGHSEYIPLDSRLVAYDGNILLIERFFAVYHQAQSVVAAYQGNVRILFFLYPIAGAINIDHRMFEYRFAIHPVEKIHNALHRPIEFFALVMIGVKNIIGKTPVYIVDKHCLKISGHFIFKG